MEMYNSEEYMKMECEEKVLQRDRPCSRRTGILVLVGSVFMIIFMVMIFVIFAHQERKFSMLEIWMNTHSSNMTSVKSQLQISERQKNMSNTEMKSLKISLISSLSALTSKLNDAERQKNMSNTEMNSLMISLSSSLSALTSKLNDAVGNQEQKLAETKRVLDRLTSFVVLQLHQQNQQRDCGENVKGILNELRTRMRMIATADVVHMYRCKFGWIPLQNNCYLFSINKLNWSEAVDYCKEEGAQLLQLEKDDDREWRFVTEMAEPAYYWIGLTDQITGEWRWADDTPYIMNKDHWYPGQPDDWKEHGLGEEGEDCVHITVNGKLNDMHCSAKLKYICKMPNPS